MKKQQRLSRAEAKARTREALLKAAEAEFSAKGFHGTSIDGVAEAAGYTKGAVYAHFRNKEALYLALLDKYLGSDQDHWIELIKTSASVRELADHINRQMTISLEETKHWAVLTLEFMVHALRHENIRLEMAERIRTVIDEYEAALNKRFSVSETAPAMPIRQLASAIMALDNGISILYYLNPEDESIRAYSSTLSLLIDRQG